MKKILSIFGVLFVFLGCSELDIKPGKLVVDRDICDRCKMIISGQDYAVEAIDLETKKRYFYDDFGCFALADRFKNRLDKAVVYVGDENGEMINMKNAHFKDGHKTPMGFGLGIVKSEGNSSFSTQEAIVFIEKEWEVRKARKMKKAEENNASHTK